MSVWCPRWLRGVRREPQTHNGAFRPGSSKLFYPWGQSSYGTLHSFRWAHSFIPSSGYRQIISAWLVQQVRENWWMPQILLNHSYKPLNEKNLPAQVVFTGGSLCAQPSFLASTLKQCKNIITSSYFSICCEKGTLFICIITRCHSWGK